MFVQGESRLIGTQGESVTAHLVQKKDAVVKLVPLTAAREERKLAIFVRNAGTYIVLQ
jgi:hypothetical protein